MRARLVRPEPGPRADRLPWVWGVILLCVNPVSVVASRKIWLQNILAPFAMMTLFAFAARKSRAGAALWGLIGTLLGQIHMSGFFFQAALVAWARGGFH